MEVCFAQTALGSPPAPCSRDPACGVPAPVSKDPAGPEMAGGLSPYVEPQCAHAVRKDPRRPWICLGVCKAPPQARQDSQPNVPMSPENWPGTLSGSPEKGRDSGPVPARGQFSRTPMSRSWRNHPFLWTQNKPMDPLMENYTPKMDQRCPFIYNHQKQVVSSKKKKKTFGSVYFV